MKNDTPNLVTIAILTLITVFLWVSFSIFRTITKEPDVIVEEAVLRDINPNLNTQILSQMERRVYISDPELSNLIQNIESEVITTPDNVSEDDVEDQLSTEESVDSETDIEPENTLEIEDTENE